MAEKSFDADFRPLASATPNERAAHALEYIAFQIGRIARGHGTPARVRQGACPDALIGDARPRKHVRSYDFVGKDDVS